MSIPSKIDARKSSAKNMENDAKMEVNIDQNYMKKLYQKKITKNDSKMKRPKAIRPKGSLGPECQKR